MRENLTAAKADKLDLYERAVQDTEMDIDFMTRTFRREQGRPACLLREDFCGTAKLCADWVRGKPDRYAWGLDLHRPTLTYGTQKHVKPLGKDAERVELLARNVLDGIATKVDITVAYNFSYCVFKQRDDLVRYCRQSLAGLKKGGVFFLDIHGGPDCQIEVLERTRHKGFTYVWNQKPMDAITGCAMRHIHFEFPDGSEIAPAFTYDWRLWTLPELVEVLYDAGFPKVQVYWEGANEDGTGNGVFRKQKKAENEDSWIAYVAAWNS
ncbi:MAG: class I SAM-dependent methyltransferase [Clostridia bacterium]|nr:class I SAM-dependent methyltransferase [Deltaproteobacteria bacterium]